MTKKSLIVARYTGPEKCEVSPGEVSYLQYTEDASKNRPAGIKGSRIPPKL